MQIYILSVVDTWLCRRRLLPVPWMSCTWGSEVVDPECNWTRRRWHCCVTAQLVV